MTKAKSSTQKKSGTAPKKKGTGRSATPMKHIKALSDATQAGLQDRQMEYFQAMSGQRNLANVLSVLVGMLKDKGVFTDEDFEVTARKEVGRVLASRNAAIAETRAAQAEKREPVFPTPEKGSFDLLSDVLNGVGAEESKIAGDKAVAEFEAANPTEQQLGSRRARGLGPPRIGF